MTTVFTRRKRRPRGEGGLHSQVPVPACFPFLCGRAVSGKSKRMSYTNPRGYSGPSDPAHCPSSSVVSFLNCVETASSWSQKAASDFSYIMLSTPVESWLLIKGLIFGTEILPIMLYCPRCPLLAMTGYCSRCGTWFPFP